MSMIRLTNCGSDDPVFINPEFVAAVEPPSGETESGARSKIHLSAGGYFYVTETVDEIMGMITEVMRLEAEDYP